jgi:hypothetical protein
VDSSRAHFLLSAYREAVLEHLFVGDLLRVLWKAGPVRADVMKAQVDDAGYDLFIEANGMARHIQLKGSFRGAKTANQKVNARLADKPSGCVVWIQFDAASMELGPFGYFGGAPGQPLPSLQGLRVARHTKGNATGYKAERPGIYVVPKSRFRVISTIDELAEVLFGPIHRGSGRRSS